MLYALYAPTLTLYISIAKILDLTVYNKIINIAIEIQERVFQIESSMTYTDFSVSEFSVTNFPLPNVPVTVITIWPLAGTSCARCGKDEFSNLRLIRPYAQQRVL